MTLGRGEPLARAVQRIEVASVPGQLRAHVGGEDLLEGLVAFERRHAGGPRESLQAVVEARLARRGRQPVDGRPRTRRDRAEALCEEVGDVGVVAAEQLVAALAGQGDLDVFGRELRDEVGRQRRRIRERLVERVGERGQQQRGVRSQRQVAVDGAVPPCDRLRAGELVERRLLEADRERAHRFRRLLSRERGERAGVDAAREEHSDRHVGDQVRAHGVAQARAALLHQFRLVLVVAGRQRTGARKTRERRSARLPGQRVAW